MNAVKMMNIRSLRWPLLILTFGAFFSLKAQAPEPPIPVEFFFGNNDIYAQTVLKRKFVPAKEFYFFNVSTYTTDYQNEDRSLVMINQLSYQFGKGFGVMAGLDMNSAVGFSPIVGPQHNFASRKWLAVTVLSYFLNDDNDLKLFGLYEFKPSINEKFSFYSRAQFIYNQTLNEGSHNRSYLYLRAGLKRNAFIFGAAANLDQYGPERRYADNYGAFVRWEF